MFDNERALNGVLYILRELGGQSNMHQIFKTLYFADQDHLANYGRSITSDRYMAMQYGPVPAETDALFLEVRGDRPLTAEGRRWRSAFHIFGNYRVQADAQPDMDYLSETDVESLNVAVDLCRNRLFSQLTHMSHGPAWHNTALNGTMSESDILREAKVDEGYVAYIEQLRRLENTPL